MVGRPRIEWYHYFALYRSRYRYPCSAAVVSNIRSNPILAMNLNCLSNDQGVELHPTEEKTTTMLLFRFLRSNPKIEKSMDLRPVEQLKHWVSECYT